MKHFTSKQSNMPSALALPLGDGLVKRREFLQSAALFALAGTGLASTSSALAMRLERFGEPLAFQAFSLRKQLATDPKTVLARMRKLGYQRIELASFSGWRNYPYGDFGALADLDAPGVASLIRDAGLSCATCHFRPDQFSPTKLDDTLRWADALKLTTLVAAQLDLPARPSRDDIRACYERLNTIGRRVRAAGFKFSVHTEGFFWRKDLGYQAEDELNGLDAAACALQFDVGSATQVGADIPALLARHGDRIVSMHLRDAHKPVDPDRYLPAVALGQGIVDLRSVISAGMQARVRDWVLEIVTFPPGIEVEAYDRSLRYLEGLSL